MNRERARERERRRLRFILRWHHFFAVQETDLRLWPHRDNKHPEGCEHGLVPHDADL